MTPQPNGSVIVERHEFQRYRAAMILLGRWEEQRSVIAEKWDVLDDPCHPNVLIFRPKVSKLPSIYGSETAPPEGKRGDHETQGRHLPGDHLD